MSDQTIGTSQYTYYPVAKKEEIPDGERIFLEIDDQPIVIFNRGGEFFAIGDVCSHDNGPVGDGAVEGYEVICPRHGARFDLRSGKATRLPAVKPIPSYPIKITDDTIEIGIVRK